MTEHASPPPARHPWWKVVLSVASFALCVVAIVAGTVLFVEALITERRPHRLHARVTDPVGPPVHVTSDVACRDFDWPLDTESVCRVLLCDGHGPVVLRCSGGVR